LTTEPLPEVRDSQVVGKTNVNCRSFELPHVDIEGDHNQP
jgi:hypothetical protein